MSWAKRNLYFLISCVFAVGLLLAAGWYCYSSWDANGAAGDQLKQAYDQASQIASKPIGAGTTNIAAAKDQLKEVKERTEAVRKFFVPVPGIPNTNHIEDRAFAFAVRSTIADLRADAQQHSVTLPADFAFSFALQQGKAVYDAKSTAQLAKQLGEVRALCDVLFSSRVISLEALQRERTGDDVNATQADYLDSTSITNAIAIITPYQITFRCFSQELARVLAGYANQPHGIVVKTLTIEPAEVATTDTTTPATAAPVVPGRLPSVIDEKKLKVTMLVNFVKLLPGQGG
jgi:hypothetical protein